MLASGISLLASAALLAGTTFAWFTDSVTNTGNVITAGNLSINAYAYKLGSGGQSFAIEGVNGDEAFTFESDNACQDLKKDPSSIIEETLWEPGQSSAKLLKVENGGTLAAKIRLEFETAGELTDALWFDFVQVKGGVATGSFTKRPMSTLESFAKGQELTLLPKESLEFILIYGMYEEAGNDYQGKSFTANVTILATQYTEESDGFGNDQYDKDAKYTAKVSTSDEFISAVEQGNNVFLTSSIVLSQNVVFNGTSVLYMNGQSITLSNGAGSIKSVGNLTVEGAGSIQGALVVGSGAVLTINGEDGLTVNSNFVTGAAVSADISSTLEINGGTYTSLNKGGAGTISFLGANLTIRNATVNVGVNSVMQSSGINSPNSKNVLLENVTVNAGYSKAVALNHNSAGQATIIGGTFKTEKAAEGLAPNPTIQYNGTLKITGATIYRIGVGILYDSTPSPTELAGLTMQDTVFRMSADSAASYENVDFG